MTYKYQFYFRVNTGKMLSSIDELENNLNKHMHDFGFSETMKLVSTIPIFTVTSVIPLTDENLAEIAKIAETHLNNDMAGYDWEYANSKQIDPTYEIENNTV